MKTLDYLHLNEKKVAGVASVIAPIIGRLPGTLHQFARYALEHQGTRLLVLHEKFE